MGYIGEIKKDHYHTPKNARMIFNLMNMKISHYGFCLGNDGHVKAIPTTLHNLPCFHDGFSNEADTKIEVLEKRWWPFLEETIFVKISFVK